MKQTLEHTKSTKGTHVFTALPDGQPPAISTLYVARWAFKGEPPKRITITVEEVPMT